MNIDIRFERKKPIFTQGIQECYRDNIYHHDNNVWIQENSHHSIYRVRVTVDLNKKEYSLLISNEEEMGSIEKISYEEDIDFINQMIIIHDNSYYYSVDEVECI